MSDVTQPDETDQPPGPGYTKGADGNWYPPQAPPSTGPGGAGYAGPPTNGMATAALVLGIVGLCLFWITGLGAILGILAIIFGVIGMNKAKQLPGQFLIGRAKAGLITGIVATVASIAFVVVTVAVFVDAVEDLQINSDPSDGECNAERRIQDPDC